MSQLYPHRSEEEKLDRQMFTDLIGHLMFKRLLETRTPEEHKKEAVNLINETGIEINKIIDVMLDENY